jgi:hypothetical protein
MEIEDISEDVYFAFGDDWATVYYKHKPVQKFEGSDSFNEAKALADVLSKIDNTWEIRSAY